MSKWYSFQAFAKSWAIKPAIITEESGTGKKRRVPTGDLIFMCLKCGVQRSLPNRRLLPYLRIEGNGFWCSDRVINHRCLENDEMWEREPKGSIQKVKDFLGEDYDLYKIQRSNFPDPGVVNDLFMSWLTAYRQNQGVESPDNVDPHNLNTSKAGRRITSTLSPHEWRLTDKLSARVWEAKCMKCGHCAYLDYLTLHDNDSPFVNVTPPLDKFFEDLEHDCDQVRETKERIRWETTKRKALAGVTGRKLALKKKD